MKLLGKLPLRGEGGSVKLVPENGTRKALFARERERIRTRRCTNQNPTTTQLTLSLSPSLSFLSPHLKTAEDIWHAFNLVRPGDLVTARTFRKVAAPGNGDGGDAGGGGGPSERVQVTLRLRAAGDGIDYDPDGPSLRVGGTNTTESEHVRLGAHHTLELAPGRAFTLEKEAVRGGGGGAAASSASSSESAASSLGGWDKHDLDRLRQATNPAATADLAALLISEGLATLSLVGGATTTLAAKVEAALPRKSGRGGVGAASGHPKALASFFDKVVASCARKVDFGVVKCFVVAGPGFTKDAFKKHLEGLAAGCSNSSAAAAASSAPAPSPDTANPSAFAAAALPRLVLAHASCAYKHALREVLSSKAVASRISDTAAAREAAALGALFETLAREPSRAFYGPGHVSAAAELGAIKTLMLSDSLFRVTSSGGGGSGGGGTTSAADLIKRRAGWEALAEGVRSAGGEVLIFSAAHSTGAALDKITGCAALLRFPAPQLEDLELEDEVGRK